MTFSCCGNLAYEFGYFLFGAHLVTAKSEFTLDSCVIVDIANHLVEVHVLRQMILHDPNDGHGYAQQKLLLFSRFYVEEYTGELRYLFLPLMVVRYVDGYRQLLLGYYLLVSLHFNIAVIFHFIVRG